MTSSRALFSWIAVPAAMIGLAGTGCQTSPAASTYSPYQGINIDSSSLVAPYGCGTGSGQVYRYVATIRELPPAPDGGYPSDAAPSFDAGSGHLLASGIFDCFADGVFEGLPVAPASFVMTIYAFTYAESAVVGFACEAGVSPCVPPALDAGAAPSGYSWTTTCTGSVEAAASNFAQCGPLLPPGAADAGPDAAPDSAADAAEAAPIDAGPEGGE